MTKVLPVTNLFRYATGELSQDAFICWLVAHATEEAWDEDPLLRGCAVDFLSAILASRQIAWTDTTRVTSIQRQYKKIDILIRVGSAVIIVEDKIFTGTHDDQLNRYRETLLEEGWAETEIILVYYKIEDQPVSEKGVDYEFTRERLLQIFRKFPSCKNPIFRDYVARLEQMEAVSRSWSVTPIADWNGEMYIGFFKNLCQTFLKDENSSWGYVPNPTGGFMGLWWFGILQDSDYERMGLDINEVEDLYIQIENDIITVKYSAPPDSDGDIVRQIRWTIYSYFHEKLGESFKKKTFRPGRYMTIGYIEYNEKNYLKKLLLLRDTLRKMSKEVDEFYD